MELVNGTTPRASREAVFDVLRPLIRVLRASGFEEDVIRSATERACRLYARSPARGLWIGSSQFADLVDLVVTWTRDPDFLDGTGSPMKLRLDRGAGSFRALLRKAGGAITQREALASLQALGAIQPCDRGRAVRLAAKILLTVRGQRFVVAPMLDSMRHFAETIEHNLCERARPGEGRMHRWAVCADLDPEQFDEAQRFARSNGQTFLEAMDEKLSACARTGPKGKRLTYGVGLYVFVDEPEATRRRPNAGRRRR